MKKPQQYKTIRGLYRQPWRWVCWMYYGFRESPDSRARDAVRNKANCFCLIGATNIVYPDIKQRHAVQHKIAKTITKLFGTTIDMSSMASQRDSLIEWNDTPGRTIDEVQRVVKEAKV